MSSSDETEFFPFDFMDARFRVLLRPPVLTVLMESNEERCPTDTFVFLCFLVMATLVGDDLRFAFGFRSSSSCSPSDAGEVVLDDAALTCVNGAEERRGDRMFLAGDSWDELSSSSSPSLVSSEAFARDAALFSVTESGLFPFESSSFFRRAAALFARGEGVMDKSESTSKTDVDSLFSSGELPSYVLGAVLILDGGVVPIVFSLAADRVDWPGVLRAAGESLAGDVPLNSAPNSFAISAMFGFSLGDGFRATNSGEK
mmetsp:Transcript_15433/g.22689  ORF Transcript_15433/g.22689 Transcript_15433/m.22689 type:complete len:258 (-) Transcript_15433:584-1357(-)